MYFCSFMHIISNTELSNAIKLYFIDIHENIHIIGSIMKITILLKPPQGCQKELSDCQQKT